MVGHTSAARSEAARRPACRLSAGAASSQLAHSQCAGQVPRSLTGQMPSLVQAGWLGLTEASRRRSARFGRSTEGPCSPSCRVRASSGTRSTTRHVRSRPGSALVARRGCNAMPPAILQLPRVQLEPMSHKDPLSPPPTARQGNASEGQGSAKGMHPRDPVQGKTMAW